MSHKKWAWVFFLHSQPKMGHWGGAQVQAALGDLLSWGAVGLRSRMKISAVSWCDAWKNLGFPLAFLFVMVFWGLYGAPIIIRMSHSMLYIVGMGPSARCGRSSTTSYVRGGGRWKLHHRVGELNIFLFSHQNFRLMTMKASGAVRYRKLELTTRFLVCDFEQRSLLQKKNAYIHTPTGML